VSSEHSRDAVRDGMIIGDAHDKAALALHEARRNRHIAMIP
jgi:hypothetical protein